MKKLKKEELNFFNENFCLTQKDMPYSLSSKTLENHLKGKGNFCYHDIDLSIKYDNSDKNKSKVNRLGNHLSNLFYKAQDNEYYNLCYNLNNYFNQINKQIDYLNNMYFNQLANRQNYLINNNKDNEL